MTVHLRIGPYTACALWISRLVKASDDPAGVTCGGCKRTRAFKARQTRQNGE